MRFSTRLAVSLLGLLAIGAVLAARLSLEARAEVRSDDTLSRTIEPALRNVERLGRRYVSLQNNVRGYLLTSDRSFLDTVDTIEAERAELIEEISADLTPVLDQTPDLLASIARAEEAWRDGAVAVELEMLAEGRRDELTAFIIGGTPNDLFGEVLAAWGDLRTAVEAELTEVRVARTDSLRALSVLGVSLVAIGVVATLLTTLWLRRTVLRPLGSLVGASSRLLAGDLETPVGKVDVPEFQPLADALDTMRRQVDGMISDKARAEVLTALDQQLAVLANDLHDDPVQAMTAALMRVHRLGRVVGPEHAGLVDSAEESIASAVQRLRRFTFALHPTGLGDDGLVATIASFARLELDDSERPHVEVRGQAPPDIGPETALVAFRITREAVVNAIRHADADRVEVVVGHDAGDLTVTITDDGRGFDTHVNTPGHRGLVSMEYLARASGGTVEVTSQPDRGTTVSVRLPERTPVELAAPRPA